MTKKLRDINGIYVALYNQIETFRRDFQALEALIDKDAIVAQLSKLRIAYWIQSVQLNIDGNDKWVYTTDQNLAVKLFPCSDSRSQLRYDPELSLIYPIERCVMIPEFPIVIGGPSVKNLYESVDRRIEKRARRTKGTGQDE